MFLQSKSKIIKSFDLVLYFDDDTQKEVIITEGDKISIDFIEDGKLYTMEGILKAINTILDDTNETCLTIDGSTEGNCLIKHVRESLIRDLTVIDTENTPNSVRVMYGSSGLVSVSLSYEDGEDYELEDDEELKLYIRDKNTYEVLIDLVSPDKNNFIVPAEDIIRIGAGEFLYSVILEHENYSLVVIPYSKFIVWR